MHICIDVHVCYNGKCRGYMYGMNTDLRKKNGKKFSKENYIILTYLKL